MFFCGSQSVFSQVFLAPASPSRIERYRRSRQPSRARKASPAWHKTVGELAGDPGTGVQWHWRSDHRGRPARQSPKGQSRGMEGAQFLSRTANVENAVVGRTVKRVLLRKLRNAGRENIANSYKAAPKLA